MAGAPQPSEPAGDRWRQRRGGRDSPLSSGLMGILSVTLATLGVAAAAAIIARVVTWLF
jgi:hypothetical protein